GPAGGVVGMAKVSEKAGIRQVIGFDMGGTSTDVTHYNGTFEKTLETELAGVRLYVPMMMIHSVAAGGGSILHFDEGRCLVGPDSAGAYPGPASYGNGGPLTITDCNVLLGKLQPDFFPSIFGPKGDAPLDYKVVDEKFEKMALKIAEHTGNHQSSQEVAQGFLRVAVENMANAIKKISVQRGYDISTYGLCSFGGAGGQHACLVADALGISKVLIHPLSGVLSAYGIGLADALVSKHQSVEAPLNESQVHELKTKLDDLESQGILELKRRGDMGKPPSSSKLLHLRYLGHDTSLAVPFADISKMKIHFEHLHQMRFGFTSPNKDLIVESISVEVVSTPPASLAPNHLEDGEKEKKGKPFSPIRKTCFMKGRSLETPFYPWESLKPEGPIEGPAVIFDSIGTVIIEPGWRALLQGDGSLILERRHPPKETYPTKGKVDPVMLEIFHNLFMSSAEQMGLVLQNTSSSVNIKERLDFSCAIFDGTGALVANAPHIPVHLGSMGESLKALMKKRKGDLRPGEAYVMNAPYDGGTHLPDITVIRPIFLEGPHKASFYVAARGHHADIGGKTPGSCPADSTHIEEEGILFENVKLVEDALFLEDDIRRLLAQDPWPARNPDTNIADLKAQLAACEKGAQELAALAETYGVETVHAYMKYIQDNAESALRKVLETLSDGKFSYSMDDGSQICVSIQVDRKERKALIDFTGTSPEHPGNFNAPPAVAKACVLYAFRCLIGKNIPLNEGALRALDIVIPEDSMINPRYPAAVVAGNVETSQCIVDALFGALGVAAASQGTMNNFIWGNERYQYYETLGGGAGATEKGPGASAVQTHMTNSRLTDPEVLEWNFPVLLESFEIRRGSGGKGKNPGGDGIIRKIKFLDTVNANIISGRRKVPPYGLHGGGPGRVGLNTVTRVCGRTETLFGSDRIELRPGDTVTIHTPGGGGYGSNDKKIYKPSR
ncbi:MAG: hydantoinase B/oxoprolinase family protein, partial [Bacteriovoracales bacterium]|nr:hydantoinase B/oxoprolinase family protein [Bacteriovoracales bacterium]